MAENEPKPNIFNLSIHQEIPLGEGVNFTKADEGGNIVEEQSVRDDARRKTGCRIEFGGEEPRIVVSGERKTRMDNLADENEAAVSLTESLNREKGTAFEAVPKVEEDSDFPDIWLHDPVAGVKVGVQIRNFDEIAVSGLGKDHEFDHAITVDELASAICKSIEKKNRIDNRLAATSYLLLISPYPLPPIIQPAICAAVSARKPEQKYLETWVASRREKSFRVQPGEFPRLN